MRFSDAATIFSGRVMTALLMLAIFATMTLMALGFPDKARLMPLMAGIPGTALALAGVMQELGRAARDAAAGPRPAQRDECRMLGWLLAYFFGILACGFLYAAPLLVLAFLRFGKGERLTTALAGAAGTWAVLYGLFERAFEIPLFDGLLIGWLAG